MVAALVALTSSVGGGAGVEEVRFTVNRIAIDGPCPLSARTREDVLRPYTGRSLGLSDLEAAAAVLEDALLTAGYAFYRVSIPPQRVEGDVVTLKISAIPLLDVRVEGNEHFDTENILASLPPLVVGASTNTLEVARALQFANNHPAKRVAVFVKQDEIGEGIDARVKAKDMRPYQVFASVNNTGTTNPGRTRLALGIQHSNLFNRDHVLTGTYTTSPEHVSDVNQYGVDYRIPVYPLALELNAFYTYSEIDQGLIGGFFDVSGRGQFYGLSATHTLHPVGAYNHTVTAGYQDRFFDNETRFAGTSLTPDVRSTPLSLRYSGNYEPKGVSLGGYAAYEFNTGFGDYNDQVYYTANRAGADKFWSKFHGGAHLRWDLPWRTQLRSRVSGQYSCQPLIPGEQFGIGGSRSVRGYEERELAGDYGIQGSIEGWAPPLFYGTRLLVFADAGQVFRQVPHPGLEDWQSIASAGAGLRWNWKGYVDVSCDVGYAFKDAITTEAHDIRLIYQVFVRY